MVLYLHRLQHVQLGRVHDHQRPRNCQHPGLQVPAEQVRQPGLNFINILERINLKKLGRSEHYNVVLLEVK